MFNIMSTIKTKQSLVRCRISPGFRRLYSIEESYTDSQKVKILEVINEDFSVLSRYEITKARLKKVSEWVERNGHIQKIEDVASIEGFTDRSTKKLFKSILEEKLKAQNLNKEIKGQILQPNLSENVRQSCESVLAVFITVNSVCWTLITKSDYKVQEWKYYGIDYPESKKMQIIDILNITWKIIKKLPQADVYVTMAEATTLRAHGSSPNNPKLLGVNLQRAQLVAMIVASINARHLETGGDEDNTTDINQRIYFLKSTLPFRLYGTLVGNERVSTEQTVDNLLQETSKTETKNQVNVPEELQAMFRSQKDLQKDMLGHCLLLALTFMDICIYKNSDSINKLLNRGE